MVAIDAGIAASSSRAQQQQASSRASAAPAPSRRRRIAAAKATTGRTSAASPSSPIAALLSPPLSPLPSAFSSSARRRESLARVAALSATAFTEAETEASTASSKAAILERLSQALKSSKAATAASAEDPRRALASALLAAAAAASLSSSSLPAALRTPERRVPGCASAAWIDAELVEGGRKLSFRSAADAALTRGAAAVLCSAASGASPAAVAALTAAEVAAAGLSDESLLAAAGGGGLSNRAGGVASLLASLKSRARAAAAVAASSSSPSSSDSTSALSPFPSLVVGASGKLEPRGAFAEAQARFLKPDAKVVRALAQALREKRVGVVAHFYMDPEVQGCLAAVAENAKKKVKDGETDENDLGWPHIKISDSLAMADAAVGMAEAGCTAVAVLGVDFMSENVRAILDAAGFGNVEVLRMSAEEIGCTLADAADDPRYVAWLRREREGAKAEPSESESEPAAAGGALHVVYINTSLRAKAAAHACVPTITCTSSNVVSTVLQAAAQCSSAEGERLKVLYGPDSYMGANLRELLSTVIETCELEGSDAAARRLHPLHTAESLRRALRDLSYYKDGACAVHEMFGGSVPATVEALYGDAAVAAHFEVPGELFRLALKAQRERPEVGGVVGSTQNILDFILAKVDEAVARAVEASSSREEGEELTTIMPLERVRVILGTESGMVTSIVNAVSAKLEAALSTAGLAADAVDVEVIFPVSADAVTTAETISSTSGSSSAAPPSLPGGLAVIPGPASGEGCSAEGGCASCPYMKMNTLSALLDVCACVGAEGGEGKMLLAARRATRHEEALSSVVGGGEGSSSSSSSSSSAKTVAEVGCAPILHMRHFQRTGVLSDELVADIRSRGRRT